MQRIILISWFLWYLKKTLENEDSHEVLSYPKIYIKSIQLITSDKIKKNQVLGDAVFFPDSSKRQWPQFPFGLLLQFIQWILAKLFFCRMHYVCVAQNHSSVWNLWWVCSFALCYCTLLFLFTQILLNYLFSDYTLVDYGFTWSLAWNNHS